MLGLAFCAALAFFAVGPAFRPVYSLPGDWSCRGSQGQNLENPEEFSFESNAFSYPMLLKRVAVSGHPQLAKFWVLHGVSPENRRLESATSMRNPGSVDEEDWSPVAFLRDDNGDSHPDKAFLFVRDQLMPKEVNLGGAVWTREAGCHFWKDPIVSFVNWALAEQNWIPGHAYGHMWTSYLKRLAEFDVASIEDNGVDPQLELLISRPSLLDESTATRVFELVSASLSDAEIEKTTGEKAFWDEAPKMAFEILRWSGFKVGTAKSKTKELSIEGLRHPLRSNGYEAPTLLVSAKKDGWKSARPAVFDVILFNNWTSQDDWERRTIRK